MLRSHCLVVGSFVLLASCRTAAVGEAPVAWQNWSAAVFEQARAGERLVLLDLGAEWCHWCHVMERTTYADPAVRALLARHFVAVEADADRRLDLAARYQDYGWPATIVFDGNGRELWKNRGYVAPARFAAVLRELVAAPVPLAADTVPPVVTADGLSAATRAQLEQRTEALYDDEHGGFGTVHKYLDLAGAEWLLAAARRDDATARARVLQTLDAERALLDPVWGGAYQYSHGGVWTNPHFEKVMSRQLADLRAYSLALGAFGRTEDLAAARSVARYLATMLRAPEGAFFASQDADVVPGEHAGDYFALADAERRALGMPRIERALWSRENGQAIEGLCALLAVDPDAELAAAAVRAAEWIVVRRRAADGTFAHGDDDAGGPFLADSLAMGAALLALAEVTAERRWLDLAVAAVAAIDARFAAPGGGYATAAGDGVLPVTTDRAENVQLARLANRVRHASGDAACERVAQRAFAWAAADAVALQPGLPADLLLAADELASEPVHVVVVGRADDPEPRALFELALRTAPGYRVVDWIAPDGTTPRGESFPATERAVAFVCADGACSAPIDDAQTLGELLAR